ncbi:HNH endonuclease [Streptococcus agalactiae]|uniref:HNH endonuclease n=1 Tax=Streptococcus agalactiae TaxID=1311 RepID=UPI0030EB9320
MPRRPSTPCKQSGCPNLVSYGNKYCDDHKANHTFDAKSTKAKGYNSRWNKARLRYLKLHPLCVYCQRKGRLTKATVVDHITPHRGDQDLFWNQTNWQSLCKSCHDRKTKTADRYVEYTYRF